MVEQKEIENGFVNELILEHNGVELHLYKANTASKAILFTKGMSSVNQHELAMQTEHIYPCIELYFFLPSYWDLNQENQKWPVSVLKRLIDGQKNLKAWFGPGDTLAAHTKTVVSDDLIDNDLKIDGNNKAINSKFKHTYFILTEPIKAEPYLNSVMKEDEQHDWLAIVPIFEEEFNFKESRSALELMMKFEKNNVSEELDEHRSVVASKKFFGLF